MIETTELTKDFRGRRAVDGLNLKVREGDVYGFLGPNGAGKSTTIRMLTGLVSPTKGTARLMGIDVVNRSVDALREVGALVETPAFYKYLTARQNLRLFSTLSGGCPEKRIDDVLDTVGLLDRANDRVKTFSHGMCQRLGIAQALLPNPKLVILDEPTSGLDPQGMRDVRELILRLAAEEKVTIFLSSHLLNEVEQVCTRVGIINQGKLIAEGAVGDLLRRDFDVVEFIVDDAGKALEVLRPLDWVEVLSPSPLEGEGRGEGENPQSAIRNPQSKITVRVAGDLIGEVNRILVTAGIEVSGIAPKTLRLEDLFLELVEEGEHAD